MMTIRGVPTYLPPANDDAMMTVRGVPTYLPSRSPKIILRNIGMVPYLYAGILRRRSCISCTRNSCAQLGAPTGSVPNPNQLRIALQLARYAHIRFDPCARIEILLCCPLSPGSGSTTCRCFHKKYPRFFLRFDRFPKRVYNARAVRGGAKLHPVHRTASEIYLPTYIM